MRLTRNQRRRLNRRTTPTSRARLLSRFTGHAPRAPSAPRLVGQAQALPAQNAIPQAPSAARQPAQFIPDATYLAGAAQRQFARTQQVNELQAEGETQRNMLQEAVRRLMEPVPEQRQGIKEGASNQGLFYSGQLGKRLSDLEASVTRQRGDLQSDYDAGARAREAARTAIMQGATVEEAAARAEAVQRQIERDAGAAKAGALARTPKPKHKRPQPKKRKHKRPKRRR